MPAKVPVFFALSALTDLQKIEEYYTSEDVPDTGRRLIVELMSRIERLADYPKSGRVVPEFAIEHLREIIQPPFRVVYRCDGKKVRIIRIWRSERLLRLP